MIVLIPLAPVFFSRLRLATRLRARRVCLPHPDLTRSFRGAPETATQQQPFRVGLNFDANLQTPNENQTPRRLVSRAAVAVMTALVRAGYVTTLE